MAAMGGSLKRSLGMASAKSAMPKGSAFEPATLPDCKTTGHAGAKRSEKSPGREKNKTRSRLGPSGRATRTHGMEPTFAYPGSVYGNINLEIMQ